MFGVFGRIVSRYSAWLLVLWVLLLAVVSAVAPPWKTVVSDGEFAFLPDDAPSRQGQELFQRAFPGDLLASSVVVVVRRNNHPHDSLQQADWDFITNDLQPALAEIAEEEPVVAGIRTFEDRAIGELLQSEDGKATLVIVDLKTEFLEKQNRAVVEKVERLVAEEGDLWRAGLVPPGLDLAISGTATVGRDMIQAAHESADATETWTIVLVLILLIAIYRAPVLAVIPLITVAAAVTIALNVLALLAGWGVLGLFSGIEVYVTVILYGAGVDYCLFLISRYKEELDQGKTFDEAVAGALSKVGAALTASAGTVMCGIGMMVFAEFGKFQQAGLGITISLFICLCAALTFTPSLLQLAGRWAFWPHMRTERITSTPGWISTSSLVGRVWERDWFRSTWDKVGQLLLAKPGTVWLVSLAVMFPFAAIGVMWYNHLSYGLLSELPRTAPSVVGTKAVQEHFPAGATGPVTVLLENREVDFSRTVGIQTIQKLTSRLNARKEELGLADVRSVSHPLGGEEGLEALSNKKGILGALKRGPMQSQAIDYYVSDQGQFANHVTRIDVVFQEDPFSRNSIQQLQQFQRNLAGLLPPELRSRSELNYLGATPSIRDLKTVTDRDQVRIDILVILGVFLILVVLLRRPAISAYLIVSVFFSYLVTLGATFALFWFLDPAGFAGLDWKVPMFLFTILIAVGEDYNIFLMTRIEEEQQKHGLIDGVIVALRRTGSIISSCGFIMAGTFSSLLAGSLVGMHQLGFALAFGVLLDTFVVRPLLVPAYLILLHSGRFGVIGKYLGARSYWPAQRVPQSVGSGTGGDV